MALHRTFKLRQAAGRSHGPPKRPKKRTEKRILNMVEKLGIARRGATIENLVNGLQLGYSTVRKKIKEMEKQGLIIAERSSKGSGSPLRIYITEKGHKALKEKD